MTDIIVVHRDLNKLGGGEAVCMTILEALQYEYDVTLYTASELNNIQRLNEYFGTSVENVEIKTMSLSGISLSSYLNKIEKVFTGSFGRFSYFSDALFNRYCVELEDECDLFISTWDEVTVNQNSIQYVHYPNRYKQFYQNKSQTKILERILKPIDSLVISGSRFDKNLIQEYTILTNSKWTASKIEDCYAISPTVLHPPINTDGLVPNPKLEERECGFVFLSRIVPWKNILDIISIIRQVRAKGFDIHLHIVGPKDSSAPQYYDEVRSASENYDFVNFEGPIWGKELDNMLKSHRYGINGGKEQFGMAVAEMVAAGMIPFVPALGGQQEIVNHNTEILFQNIQDSVQKISNMLSDDELQLRTRQSLPNIAEKYGKEKFQEDFTKIVRSKLNL